MLFMSCVCHVFASVHCSLVVTCWERANLLTILCLVFYCGFVTFPVVPGSGVVLDCIGFDLCLLTYFVACPCFCLVICVLIISLGKKELAALHVFSS